MIVHKYQALGNDFLIFDCINYPENLAFKANSSNFMKFVMQKSDRRRIGCDQFIVMEKSEKADCKIVFYNADGSRAEACGNGTVASGVYAAKFLGKSTIQIETDTQVVYIKVDGNQATIELEMPKDLGLSEENKQAIIDSCERHALHPTMKKMWRDNIMIQSISVGNPHCVIFLPAFLTRILRRQYNIARSSYGSSYVVNALSDFGDIIENLTQIFPNRTNVEFVVKTGENKFDVFIWERGAGRTFACGTGACAVAFACVKNNLADASRPIEITMAGSFLYAENVPMMVLLKESTVEFTNSAFFEGEIHC